ncbi:MAG: D-alanyl-D-alanine carboxypeptidase [Oscillospiraceae bacterium]|nr:D-alanyl-D-alanine carboxypeptidase [Oscillospiraceae bacterium]
MKKFVSMLLCTALLIGFVTALPAQAAVFSPSFDVNAESVYMVNLDTGFVVYEKNADVQRAPASLTKMMTALLFIEAIGAENLSTTEITAPGYIYDELYNTGSSSADVRPYETLSAQDVLYGMLLPSGNECASIAADYVANGSMENFFYMMNARARALGCKNTNFTSAHGLFGLEANHYSTAYDMYLIGKACYENETFMQVATTQSYTRPANNKHAEEVTVRNTNYMQSRTSGVYRSYIRGLKTGSTPEAGYNLVTSASQDGENYLLVVMGTPYEKDENGYGLAFGVSAQLYDWAFDNFNVSPALDVEKPCAELKIKYSTEADTVMVYPKESFMTLLPSDSDETVLQKTYNVPEYVTAPVKKGDTMGYITLTLSGETIGYVELICGSDVERNQVLYITSKILEFLNSTYFKIVFALVVIVVIIYAAYVLILLKKNHNSRRVRRTRR